MNYSYNTQWLHFTNIMLIKKQITGKYMQYDLISTKFENGSTKQYIVLRLHK